MAALVLGVVATFGACGSSDPANGPDAATGGAADARVAAADSALPDVAVPDAAAIPDAPIPDAPPPDAPAPADATAPVDGDDLLFKTLLSIQILPLNRDPTWTKM